MMIIVSMTMIMMMIIIMTMIFDCDYHDGDDYLDADYDDHDSSSDRC